MTKSNIVEGLVFGDSKGIMKAPIAVRATKDDIGRSLSLAIDGVIMLHIPVEPVQELLKWVSGEEKE